MFLCLACRTVHETPFVCSRSRILTFPQVREGQAQILRVCLQSEKSQFAAEKLSQTFGRVNGHVCLLPWNLRRVALDTSPDSDSSRLSRLSRIDTPWSIVRCAHQSQNLEATAAQKQLLERYGGAIRRYLLAALRDREAADEMFQEFALKFVRGDFKSVDPDRGRFRSFVKTVLYRMVAGHFRKKGTRKELNLANGLEQEFESETPTPKFEEQFFDSWRDDLLASTWRALEEYERDGGGPYHTVLQLRIKNPGLKTDLLAGKISQELGKPISAGSGRVLVHRSREKFAFLLIENIADSLEHATADAIESELIDLQLIDYCRDALVAHRTANEKPDRQQP